MIRLAFFKENKNKSKNKQNKSKKESKNKKQKTAMMHVGLDSMGSPLTSVRAGEGRLGGAVRAAARQEWAEE